MALYLDSANLEQIEAFLQFRGLGGITTNPTILAKEKAQVSERLPAIAKLMQTGLLFAQTREQRPENILADAKMLHEICPERMVVKIPFCEDGLTALPLLKENRIRSCPTAIFNAGQAYLAAAQGADWIAVYVNRITILGGDGLEVVRTISGIYEANQFPTRILAASVKTLDQVESLLEIGERVDITIPFSLLQNMLMHPATEKALNAFALDAAKVF